MRLKIARHILRTDKFPLLSRLSILGRDSIRLIELCGLRAAPAGVSTINLLSQIDAT